MKKFGINVLETHLSTRQGSLLSFCILMSGLCLVLVFSGCISVSNSPTSRFYVLQALLSENQVSKEINMTSDVAAIGQAERDSYGVPNPKPALIERSEGLAECRAQSARPVNSAMVIGVGPIKIPEYQDRPQIVTRGKEKMLKFAQFDRWGESLTIGVARIIREDLAVMLPGSKGTLYPWNSNIAVKYQVVVEIVQLDSELDKELSLVAQWMVIDAQNAKTMMIRRSEFRYPIIPQNYSGLVKTLSTACASLSGEIAEKLVILEKTKEDASASKQ